MRTASAGKLPKNRATPEAKPKQQPWWLDAGSENCTSCSHGYAYRTESYCVDCDGPVCSVCVETITVESLCPDCFKTRSSESEVTD